MVSVALEAGADFVGFVLYPPSPRFVHFFQAAILSKMARDRAKIVALLVDPDDTEIAQVINDMRPDYIQLHGGETAPRVEEIVDKFQIDVIKAISIETSDDVEQADAYSAAKFILFDAKPPVGSELPGGNGVPFDWSLLASLAGKNDYMLSGGLTSETVLDAIRETGCKMVDVSSGVESAPGVKDEEKIRAFVRAAKSK